MKTTHTKKYAKEALEFWEGILTRTNLPENQHKEGIITFREYVEKAVDEWKKFINDR